MHLALNLQGLCAPCQIKGALLLYWISRWTPSLYSSYPQAPRKRSPDAHVWVRPKHHIHKDCDFPLSLHTSFTMDCPSRWRHLLRVLCPVRRPVTALDWVLLKDRNWALAPGQGPEINYWACLCVSPRPRSWTLLTCGYEGQNWEDHHRYGRQ